MFTGIVEGLCPVVSLTAAGERARLVLELAPFHEGVAVGDSVACNGVCLSVAAPAGSRASFDVIAETLRRTTLGRLRAGEQVNVERALRPSARLDGHFVQGHVDGVGTVAALRVEPGQTVMTVRFPAALAGLLIPKGSIAVDGVSLTVAALATETFDVCLIPHTLAVTTLGRRRAGDGVNLEADMIGKYVVRTLERWRAETAGGSVAGAGGAPAAGAGEVAGTHGGLSEDTLRGWGYGPAE